MKILIEMNKLNFPLKIKCLKIEKLINLLAGMLVMRVSLKKMMNSYWKIAVRKNNNQKIMKMKIIMRKIINHRKITMKIWDK